MKFMKYLTEDYGLAPPPKPDHKRCTACKTERPLSDFVRKASLAQSKAWTKKPSLEKRLTYESRICNVCFHEKQLNPKDLSPEAYRKRLVNEGLHPMKIEARVKARRAQGALVRREKTSRTLLQNAMPELRPMFAEIADFEKKLRNKLVHLQRSHQGESEGAVFCAKYGILFDNVKQQLKMKAKAGQKLPTTWRSLISDKFVVDLWELFRALPDEHKQRFAVFMSALPRTPEN
jgi:hypothetical protein